MNAAMKMVASRPMGEACGSPSPLRKVRFNISEQITEELPASVTRSIFRIVCAKPQKRTKATAEQFFEAMDAEGVQWAPWSEVRAH